MSRARLAIALAVVSSVALSAPVAGGSSPTPKKNQLRIVIVGPGAVVSTPRGIACPPRCSAKFPPTARIVLRARPEAGFAFARWRGACAGTGGCTVNLRIPRNVVAVFRLERTGPPPNTGSPPPTPPSLPPPPPPPPAATPGHYVGKTSHLTDISFEVVSDSSRLVNLRTGQINESCTPEASLSGGNIAFEWMRINRDGTFGFSGTGQGTVDGMPSEYSLAITGRFSGGTATGTIETATAFTYGGTPYSCKSGVVTFTATRTG